MLLLASLRWITWIKASARLINVNVIFKWICIPKMHATINVVQNSIACHTAGHRWRHVSYLNKRAKSPKMPLLSLHTVHIQRQTITILFTDKSFLISMQLHFNLLSLIWCTFPNYLLPALLLPVHKHSASSSPLTVTSSRAHRMCLCSPSIIVTCHRVCE